MVRRSEKKIGEILVEKGLINSAQLNDALSEQKRTKGILGSILIKRRLIDEEALLKVLSEQFDIPFERIKFKYIDWEFVKKFSPSLILDHKCIPLEADGFSATIAINNPLDIWAIGRAEEETKTRGYNLNLVLSPSQDIDDVIRRYHEYMKGEK